MGFLDPWDMQRLTAIISAFGLDINTSLYPFVKIIFDHGSQTSTYFSKTHTILHSYIFGYIIFCKHFVFSNLQTHKGECTNHVDSFFFTFLTAPPPPSWTVLLNTQALLVKQTFHEPPSPHGCPVSTWFVHTPNMNYKCYNMISAIYLWKG